MTDYKYKYNIRLTKFLSWKWKHHHNLKQKYLSNIWYIKKKGIKGKGIAFFVGDTSLLYPSKREFQEKLWET